MRQIFRSIACLTYVLLIAASLVQARTLTRSRDSLMEEQNQSDDVADFMDRLEQSLLQGSNIDNVKRNLDLGFSRGFSGSQAAKHLMGLAAANFAGGPGRKRRSLVNTQAADSSNINNAWQ